MVALWQGPANASVAAALVDVDDKGVLMFKISIVLSSRQPNS